MWLYSSCLLLLKQHLCYEVHLQFPQEQAWDAFPGCDGVPTLLSSLSLHCLQRSLFNVFNCSGCVTVPSHAAGCAGPRGIEMCLAFLQTKCSSKHLSVLFWSPLKCQVYGLRNTQCNSGVLQEECSWKLFPLG